MLSRFIEGTVQTLLWPPYFTQSLADFLLLSQKPLSPMSHDSATSAFKEA